MRTKKDRDKERKREKEIYKKILTSGKRAIISSTWLQICSEQVVNLWERTKIVEKENKNKEYCSELVGRQSFLCSKHTRIIFVQKGKLKVIIKLWKKGKKRRKNLLVMLALSSIWQKFFDWIRDRFNLFDDLIFWGQNWSWLSDRRGRHWMTFGQGRWTGGKWIMTWSSMIVHFIIDLIWIIICQICIQMRKTRKWCWRRVWRMKNWASMGGAELLLLLLMLLLCLLLLLQRLRRLLLLRIVSALLAQDEFGGRNDAGRDRRRLSGNPFIRITIVMWSHMIMCCVGLWCGWLRSYTARASLIGIAVELFQGRIVHCRLALVKVCTKWVCWGSHRLNCHHHLL